MIAGRDQMRPVTVKGHDLGAPVSVWQTARFPSPAFGSGSRGVKRGFESRRSRSLHLTLPDDEPLKGCIGLSGSDYGLGRRLSGAERRCRVDVPRGSEALSVETRFVANRGRPGRCRP